MPRRPQGKRGVESDGRVTVRGKAANGEGSVYFAGGRWRATYRVAGDTRPRSVSASTRELVIAKRAERLEHLASTAPGAVGLLARSDLKPSTSLGVVAGWWLHNVQRHQVRASTWAKAEDRVRRIVATLGDVPVGKLRVEHVVTWQSDLLEKLAPKTVAHHRQTLAQVMDQAVELGLTSANPVRRVKPPRPRASEKRALSVADARALVSAASDDRYGAVVALLFFQGWRVSEALGLAWEDLDLDAGTATVRRACVYVDHQGLALGPTKTEGALGDHHLAPTVVDLLRRRRAAQAADRLAAGSAWQEQTCDGQPVNLVFTTTTGGLVLRHAITKAIAKAATRAGIDADRIGTHTGRRSVVTALYAEAGESIEEIARYVGHASPATTSGYVRSLGNRPAAFAQRAVRLLDPAVL